MYTQISKKQHKNIFVSINQQGETLGDDDKPKRVIAVKSVTIKLNA